MPLRILYLTPDLFGPPSGIARYCRMVCRSLAHNGHRVTTVSLLDDEGARTEARETFPAMSYFPCGAKRRPFIRHALRAVRTRPDIILVGHPNFAPLGWLLARMTGAPVVSFIYGIDAWEPLSKVRRAALGSAERIVSISRFTAKSCARVNGIAPDKVRILHNCLDPNFQGREALASANASLSLLTVARISLAESYKGHDIVIRALGKLLQRFPSLVYNVVGDGDGRGALEALANELGVAHAVHFHGVVSERELIESYESASVFVMPSRFEGFGFVFLEAMTYGKPVVCGNEDASPEVVCDGETGFCVPPTAVDEVAAALERLLGDAELRARMGAAAKKRVEEHFGFPAFEKQLTALLAEVAPLAKSHSAA